MVERNIQRYLMMELLEDSDEDSDFSSDDSLTEEVQFIAAMSERQKRHCIPNYFENVTPLYMEDEFKTHFRISRQLFNTLTEEFRETDTYQNLCDHYNTVSHCKHLAVFLWFTGHEACSYRDIADRFDISLWTVHQIIYRVIRFLSNMSSKIIQWPNVNDRIQTAQRIELKYSFPGIVGSIDGTHIIIDPPIKNKDDYIDRKGNTSICLQGICDDRKKIIDVFIGYPGSVHDSRLLKNSPIYSDLPELIQNGHYLLGDSAYPCQQYLMVPYRDNGHMTRPQKHFNKSLSKIRVHIEHTFGMLKQRFRQLYYCKLKNIEILCHFVRACCVLHNLADQDDLRLFVNDIRPEDDDELMFYEGHDENGRALRDQICAQIFRH